VKKIQKDEDGLAHLLGMSLTPREHMDEVAETMVPNKATAQRPAGILPNQIPAAYTGYLLSFDGGHSRTHKTGGAAAVLWKLPEWEVEYAGGVFVTEVTNNMTEYHALLWGMKVAAERGISSLIAVGDSNLVIKQVMGLHQCRSAELTVLLRKVKELEAKFELVQYVHVTRDFNASADHVATMTLRGACEYCDKVDL
jgi:ribonuclease HI